jgi:sugar phosphate isomerase/epimerase
MKLGISSWTFTWAVGISDCPPLRPLGPLDLLDKASDHGVRVLQIADNMPLHEQPMPVVDYLAAEAKRRGIALELGTRGIALAHLRTYLHLALKLGAPFVRVVIDTPTHQPDADEIIRMLSEIAPDYQAAGVALAVENHDRIPLKTLRRIVQAVDIPAVGICLDPGNCLSTLEGPEAVVETLGEFALNLHVKDFDVFRARYGMGFIVEGRPVGQGKLDLPWLLSAVHKRARGREFNAILEQWTPPHGSVEETIAIEAKWAAMSIRYLRKLIPD